MTFSRLLPLLLLVPALTMADEDRNFKLSSENFKVGNALEHATNFAIVLDSSVAISQEPVFPLLPNRLYLRHKNSAKEYLWFSGEAKAEEYKKLHAYNLKENHLGAREVLGLRLYASRQYKAFQDEADIYFDTEYIYSPRVSKLLFMKNGKWEVLKESVHPGMVQILSDEKNLEIVSLSAKMKPGTRSLYPVNPGTYVFSFNAPDQLPYADIGNLQSGEVLTFNVKFPAPDTSVAVTVDSNAAASSSAVASSSSAAVLDSGAVSSSSADSSNSVIAIPDFDAPASSSSVVPVSNVAEAKTAPVVPSVTIEQVQALQTLEETEALYDAFSAEVDKNFKRVDTTEFSKFYPAIKPADSLGLADSGKVYRGYVAHYNLKRSEAQNLWRQKKLGVVSNLYKAFHAKLDSLQALPFQINMMPVAIEKIMKAPDTTIVIDSSKSPADTIMKIVESNKIDSLNLSFGAERERVEVSWKGVVESFPMDSLVTLLAEGNTSLVTTLFLVNNKPVWVFKEGDLVGRYQYRYEKLGFRMGDSLYFGKGEFKLPKHILVEKEVEEWLKRGPESSSSVAPSSSSAAPDTVKTEPVFNVVEHASRGTVALIDSGSFRYRGKVVSMSPFAIHTTEVTQEFFHKIMGLLDSTKRYPDKSAFKGPNKPVQNITWENAQYACKVLGGDLPTEAQWEFAGRAGSNDGYLWTSDDAMGVNKYAVFAGNSFKKGKKDADYGPHDVASKAPNAWGLYDMSGNVAEWTRDNYFAITFSIESSNPTGSFWGTSKVLKGGSWKDKEKKLNMTARDDEDPRYWSDGIGFRCVFTLDKIIQGK
ncbi:conserved domain protein [Fibrobacter succinogenes subsp. succinogenes S85]|uniref:Conserved domain protein n=1 Tax=Fibrobacter succinogenes (strain ATCC 19169 / S85) TaxID=59374 RepID=C9RM45_FIBSS|nr:SUMF1/EgtB/PvdO family nonheme iron enzyme [Fibrobacter succinogenes]ACX74207.1 protein of unknown function DUF323 [Fibrobacter succinogenes subsp. succinogenes S85]ADL25645.1 conserved domain protein [Fibrobacter succinogenes subsp. succinogenes S85]